MTSTATLIDTEQPGTGELAAARWWLKRCRVPRVRTMRQWAEDELIFPKGPCEGEPFRIRRQPFMGLVLDEFDSDRWTQYTLTGPVQSGKSTIGYQIPVAYGLFEIQETTIAAAPDDTGVADIWHEQLLPLIERTRYSQHLPRTGPGSRGGRLRAVRFGHGVTLRFMTAGGSDKARASYTAPRLAVTEVEGFDVVAETSKEGTKIDQLLARTKAFSERTGRPPQVYLECSLTTSDGRTYREIKDGSDSRILVPCPHCLEWICPDRAHLLGWQDAESELEAVEKSYFICPDCGQTITESERDDCNRLAVLVHKGQTAQWSRGPRRGRRGDPGRPTVSGDPPPTRRFGVRWNPFNNLLKAAGDAGLEEYRAARAVDEITAERTIKQFLWAMPDDPPGMDRGRLDYSKIARRTVDLMRGQVPEEAEHVTAALDLGKYVCHWVALAFRPDGGPHVTDYGQIETPQLEAGLEEGLIVAMQEFADLCRNGWQRAGGTATIQPEEAWVDSSWQPRPVYAFIRAQRAEGITIFRPTKGFGVGQTAGVYRRPKDPPPGTEEYHPAWQDEEGIELVHVNADHWKSHFHNRLAVPVGGRGAMTLFKATPREHWSFTRQLTAEMQEEKYSPRHRAIVVVWDNPHKRANHWFDGAYLACAAGHCAGVRLAGIPRTETKTQAGTIVAVGQTPDGRPFLATER